MWKTFSIFICALVSIDDVDPETGKEEIKMELVAGVIFQENGLNLQLEFLLH